MPISIASQISSISQQFHAAKKILQDVAFDANIESTTFDKPEVDGLEQVTSEILFLIRSLKNRLAPINRIPPEVLTLIPDSWDINHKDEVITLTHVCRVWREMFISRSSLWTIFNCRNADKTRVYLERSKSCSIGLWMIKTNILSPGDPFLQVIPHSIGRLKSLSVAGTPENLQGITAHLSHHAPLLERLVIDGSLRPGRNPTLTATLFNGDLSSLRTFYLQSVYTQLPWRNMVNLTTFVLHRMPSDGLSIRQLLDFFESAPRLRKIKLDHATPASGGQNGRLVSLTCLKKMEISWGLPSSPLLDHLLIPVGAKLTEWVDSFDRLIEDNLPKSLDNLRNISNFTEIYFQTFEGNTRIQLSGSSGKLKLCIVSPIGNTWSGLESLAQLDTSKVKRLEVVSSIRSFIRLPCRALLPLESLRTLRLSRCKNPRTFLVALHPNPGTSEVVTCPKLEELVLVPHTNVEEFDIGSVTEIAAARALRGAKLRTIRIVGGRDKLDPRSVLELRKHVLQVEYDPEVGVVDDGESDDSDEEY